MLSVTSPHAKTTWRQVPNLELNTGNCPSGSQQPFAVLHTLHSLCASPCLGINFQVKEPYNDHSWRRPQCYLAHPPLCKWEDRSPLREVATQILEMNWSKLPNRLGFSLWRLPPSLWWLCFHLDYANLESNSLLVPNVFKLSISNCEYPIAWPLSAADEAARPYNMEQTCSSSSCFSVAWDQEPNMSFNNSMTPWI